MSGGRWVWMPDGPATFPGGGWYAPSVTASPQTTVTYRPELGDEERAELERLEQRRRELGGFGFGRVLEAPE